MGKIIAGLTIMLVMAGSPLVYAEPETAVPAEQPAAVETVETVVAVEVGNKICPVSKEKVGEMGDIVKYEYNGKIYNLCCPMCKKDFAKDPEKFAKIAEDEVAASQAMK